MRAVLPLRTLDNGYGHAARGSRYRSGPVRRARISNPVATGQAKRESVTQTRSADRHATSAGGTPQVSSSRERHVSDIGSVTCWTEAVCEQGGDVDLAYHQFAAEPGLRKGSTSDPVSTSACDHLRRARVHSGDRLPAGRDTTRFDGESCLRKRRR